MNSSPTQPTGMSGPFRGLTTSLVGMLSCIFATIIAMVSVSTDQTGTSVAVIVQSFDDSLRSQPIEIFESSPSEPPSKIFRFASANNRVPSSPEFPERKFQDDEELFAFDSELLDETNEADQTRTIKSVEVRGFPHFIQELGRLRSVSGVEVSSLRPTVDFISSETMTAEAQADSICSFIVLVLSQSPSKPSPPPFMFRATLWSPSPAFTMLAEATREAQSIEQLVRVKLNQKGIENVSVAVEASAWMSSTVQRPAFSVCAETASFVISE